MIIIEMMVWMIIIEMMVSIESYNNFIETKFNSFIGSFNKVSKCFNNGCYCFAKQTNKNANMSYLDQHQIGVCSLHLAMAQLRVASSLHQGFAKAFS